ncbi:hypothetical protein RHABOEDO_000727 [Candidatus Rhabdochlamydia oedothoracis]|uniref:Uncharacterized protein n=1 Tax=Candidatus Rhabdochlamydia oedothoracis TaxID=2720720 RepID=A0ABX8V525_9BACT|nr:MULTISPECIES: hypothetical protein [Rhabdochlamydia]KAG6559661.1 hypothetical protein RHOW815_000331 [Candidatus Rhabdochlamydia sp. W815]MCL6755567.1 hypothetical protein [Candidatus Rhabdochlamydia oedothoracis]QYF48545.1 hypothetical protein RHABOEDO_000727 [Candidatus Rhabdochlamydia oedothoracis]
MIISLSEYYYTNRFIPASTDPTILKVVKVSALIFLGLFAFFLDCTHKLLAYRNITQEKDPLNLSNLKETPHSAEKIQSTPPIVEQISIETHVDKYAMNLAVQRKTLEKYILLNNFQVTPEEFFKNLKLFMAEKPINFKLVPVFKEGLFSIYKHLIKVIESLLKQHSSNELSNDYEKYTYAIRDLLQTEEYKKNKFSNSICLLIQELCFAKFMDTVLTDLQEKTLENRIKFDPSRNMTLTNISKWIEEDNRILRKLPKGVRQSFSLNCEKACNAAGINSDQLSSANIPELRSVHKVKWGIIESYDVYYIRYPTPTIETTKSFCARITRNNATVIAPEFLGFLDSIQRKKIRFLYVNHQYMDKKGNGFLLSADNNRAEAIQRLEETYTEVFYFLSLPFDGPTIEEIDKKNLAKWKENLVDNVIGEKEGFRIPKKFREFATSKREEIEHLLNKLLSLYFSGKSEFNKIERRVLLVIFYSYLKEYFKSEYQIRIMASVCKDNKDRGNVSACIDEVLFNLRLGKEKDQQTLKDLHLRILSPFIFRNEGIVEHRLQFLTDLLNHIAKLDDDQKEKIRAFKVNEQYQIVDQWISRSNDGIIV